MDDTLTRIWEHLVGRLTGPLTLRLFLQPAMATLFAVRDGVRDARAGRTPFLLTILGHPDERRRLIREGLGAIGKLVVIRRIYPGEAIDVALLLAIVPYFVLRGPVNRIARAWVRPSARASGQRSRPGR